MGSSRRGPTPGLSDYPRRARGRVHELRTLTVIWVTCCRGTVEQAVPKDEGGVTDGLHQLHGSQSVRAESLQCRGTTLHKSTEKRRSRWGEEARGAQHVPRGPGTLEESIVLVRTEPFVPKPRHR